MAGTLTTNSVTLGDSATAANNFQLRSNTDGSMKLARGATGALGDILTVDASGNATLANGMRINSSGNLLFNSGYGSAATAYGCRAWVNFDGTGTPAIRASGNVSSITDNGSGDYTVNFTTALPDSNYSTTALASRASPESENYPNTVGVSRSPTTSSVRLFFRNYASASNEDSPNVNVAVFR